MAYYIKASRTQEGYLILCKFSLKALMNRSKRSALCRLLSIKQTRRKRTSDRPQASAKGGNSPHMIEKAYENIAEYADARGAVLFDIRAGKRIDGRGNRGVRVSRVDLRHMIFKMGFYSQHAGKFTNKKHMPSRQKFAHIRGLLLNCAGRMILIT